MKAAFSKTEFESELSSRFATAFKPRGKSPAEVIPTGLTEVDSLVGGFPRGAITEIFGLTSSGRTTLSLAALAEATSREEVCAWIDADDTFHPTSAASAGVALDRVLWIRSAPKLENAFKATDLLLQGGGFGFVLLDLGDVPSQDSKRIISSWWYRFRRVIENTPTAFVVMAQDSCVRSCASLTLELKRNNETWSNTVNVSLFPDVSSNHLSQRSKFPTAVIFPKTTPAELTRPTHSNLLTGLHLELERHKPTILGERSIAFGAGFFSLDNLR